MLEPEIYVSSEVDAKLDDPSGDVVIVARGQEKARLTLPAATALHKRLGEAIANSRETPTVKKIIPTVRKRPENHSYTSNERGPINMNRDAKGRFT